MGLFCPLWYTLGHTYPRKIPMNRDSMAIPIAIVVAAGLIAGAIYYTGLQKAAQFGNVKGSDSTAQTDPTATKPVVKQVQKEDHIRGNPNAPIMLAEYSDFDCPYCKQFHETLTKIMAEYGSSGKVAWVYRQFPLQQLHPNAPKLAQASECVAELGGNAAFWSFADSVFNIRKVGEFTDMTRLPEYAATAGVDKAAFQSCLDSGKEKDKVDASIKEAIAAGGNGTPHTLVLVGNQSGAINGSQPYEAVKAIIDNLINQMNGGTASSTPGA